MTGWTWHQWTESLIRGYEWAYTDIKFYDPNISGSNLTFCWYTLLGIDFYVIYAKGRAFRIFWWIVDFKPISF